MPLYFGVFVSLFAYLIGMELKKKFGWPVLNPLLVADHSRNRVFKGHGDHLHGL